MSTTTSFDRDSQARWYARRHLDFDPEVVHIFHLPRNAKPREIRFLEVNRTQNGNQAVPSRWISEPQSTARMLIR